MKIIKVCKFDMDDHDDYMLRLRLEEFANMNQEMMDDPGRTQVVQVDPVVEPGIPGGGAISPETTDYMYLSNRVCDPQAVFCTAVADNVFGILREMRARLRQRVEHLDVVGPDTRLQAEREDPALRGKPDWEAGGVLLSAVSSHHSQQLERCEWLIDKWCCAVFDRMSDIR